MKKLDEIIGAIENSKTRGAWATGVKQYALEILESVQERAEYENREPENVSELYSWMLNGAQDYRKPGDKFAAWVVYSEGGSSLIYDGEICARLCNATEKKITRNGEKDPNSRETWLQVQARALYQAADIITREARKEA